MNIYIVAISEGSDGDFGFVWGPGPLGVGLLGYVFAGSCFVYQVPISGFSQPFLCCFRARVVLEIPSFTELNLRSKKQYQGYPATMALEAEEF